MMRWRRYGPCGLLFQFADEIGDLAFARGRAIALELERARPPGLIEFTPAFTTLLIEFDPRVVSDPGALAEQLTDRFKHAASQPLPPAPVHQIPVIYDGADLERVARLHSLTPSEVTEIHAATVYKVYMLGFSPGFPYLGDLDPRLHTPRLPTPRTRVPAGSVAIGGEHTGIYTVDSPGGWNLIGRTPVALFDVNRAGSPFLLSAGDQVKFVTVSS